MYLYQLMSVALRVHCSHLSHHSIALKPSQLILELNSSPLPIYNQQTNHRRHALYTHQTQFQFYHHDSVRIDQYFAFAGICNHL
jgi:hypothetical protein